MKHITQYSINNKLHGLSSNGSGDVINYIENISEGIGVFKWFYSINSIFFENNQMKYSIELKYNTINFIIIDINSYEFSL